MDYLKLINKIIDIKPNFSVISAQKAIKEIKARRWDEFSDTYDVCVVHENEIEEQELPTYDGLYFFIDGLCFMNIVIMRAFDHLVTDCPLSYTMIFEKDGIIQFSHNKVSEKEQKDISTLRRKYGLKIFKEPDGFVGAVYKKHID